MRLGARTASASSYSDDVVVGLAEHVADVHEHFPVGAREAQERQRLIDAHVEARVRVGCEACASARRLQNAVFIRYFAETLVEVCGIVASIVVCRS